MPRRITHAVLLLWQYR